MPNPSAIDPQQPHHSSGHDPRYGALVPVPGGVLIRRDGQIIGALGITGDTSDNDELCALAGIAAAKLKAQDA